MKIAMSADWHINSQNRIDDFIKTSDCLIKELKKIKPDMFVFIGDSYRNWHPLPLEMNVFHKTIYRIAEICKSVKIVVGNHDWPESDEQNGKHCFTEIQTLVGPCDNISVYDNPHIIEINDDKDIKKLLIFIPHIPKSKLINNSYSNAYAKILLELLSDYDNSWIKILFSHAYIQGAKVGSGDMVVQGDNKTLSLSILTNSNINYGFFGDIHKQQQLSIKPAIYYTGSLERVDFGERLDKKGFLLLDTSLEIDKQVKFIEIPTRQLQEVIIDLTKPSDFNNIYNYIIKLLLPELQQSIVKLKIICTKQQKVELDNIEKDIIKYLFKIININSLKSISYEIVDTVVVRNSEINEMLDPQSAFRKWLEIQPYTPNVDNTMVESVLNEGINIIKGQ